MLDQQSGIESQQIFLWRKILRVNAMQSFEGINFEGNQGPEAVQAFTLSDKFSSM